MSRFLPRWASLMALSSCGIFLAMEKSCGDEGMWLLNDPPRQRLQERYHFELSDTWLERAQGASIRFNSGGSGSFVSSRGLIVTNHHVGADALQKLSPPGKDYLKNGFLARTEAEELRCPDLELNVLHDIQDVTREVNEAVKPEMSPAESFLARRAITARLEKESLDRTGFRSDVVVLYQGAQYHLYRYKKYTDVRLVFAPEQSIAFFGGETDNFEFPRFNLDVCFFRAYERDRPVRPAHHFRWSAAGPSDGDLVFVLGNPGATNRLDTLAMLRHRRDHLLPYSLNRLRMQEALLEQLSAQGPEQARMARKDLHRVANGRKAVSGQYQGLLDPAILRRKQEEEEDLRRRLANGSSDRRGELDSALARIVTAEKVLAGFQREWQLLEKGEAFDSQLFQIARHLVRLAAERSRPNADRLREYRDSSLESLELHLFSPAPIHSALELARLAGSLSFLAENLGRDHPVVVKVLGDKGPAARAAELVNGSKLIDPGERRRLARGGLQAIEQSTDAMIVLARHIDADARSLRKRYDTEVEEVQRQANAVLARLRFEVHGTRLPPDATFTLRLAYGVVSGYREDGKEVPCCTTFRGAFERADRQQHREPFVLPRRWQDARERLDLDTPFNFVSTADTIGGSSGSPVVNRAGELVGINFDRNRFGLVRNFVYSDKQARNIAVHSRAVLVALRSLYEAEELLKELTSS